MKKRTRTPGFNSEVRKVNPYAGIIVWEIADIISRGLLVGTVMSAVPIKQKRKHSLLFSFH